MSKHHITVIGGGITGLTAAYTIRKRAAELGRDVSCTLIERHPELGGKLVTEKRDGFLIDGGPDSFITQKPHGIALCKELGLEDHLLPCNTAGQKVFILHRGKLESLPEGVRLTVPTKYAAFLKSPLISPAGKLRMLMEPWVPARKDGEDESLADFVRRRLGREAVDRLAGPLMAGIYVSDPYRMSMQGTFPLFVQLEKKYGSLIKGMRTAARERARSGRVAPAMFMSLKGGMGELASALIERIGDDARTGTRVEALRPCDGGGYEIVTDRDTFPTDAVICTAPAFAAADLVESLAPAAANQLRTIRYVSTATVSMGFRARPDSLPHGMKGFGFVVPKYERCPLLACTWSSTKFDHRAPDGTFLVRAFFGGEGREDVVDLEDGELVALARRELGRIMGLTGEPAVTAVYRWTKANPQYDVGHLGRMDQVDEELRQTCPNLILAGGAYRGIGIPDCIHGAQQAVDQILTT